MATQTQTNHGRIYWYLLGILLAFGFGGIGFVATSALLKLPTSPNCSQLSLFFTSATNRIYCAQLEAKKDTVEGLLKAIALVRELGDDHPLENEINRYIDKWSNNILGIAEQQFQAGRMDEAITTANQLPSDIKNYAEVETKIDTWRSVWSTAENIENKVENELKEAQWNKAFLMAIKLLNIQNEYWQTTKYQETIKTINLAREENKKLDGAYTALEAGGIDNLLTTMEIASVIPASSYSYEQAQKLIDQAETALNDLAKDFIDKRDWDNLASLSTRLPDDSRLKEQAHDWSILASAGRNANLSTVSGMELAIAEAEQLSSDSNLYSLAKELIERWHLEKGDLAHLATAKDIARPGNVGDLRAAIVQAELITRDNPRYQEAQLEIRQWQRKIQIIEDQPLLNQARQIAASNNIPAWRKAINQARQISSGRALYSDARSLISQWQRQIEREEDQPILNQAIALEGRNNYQAAIDVAARIGRGRVLYREAQSKIRSWRTEIMAERDLQQSYQVAEGNNVDSLVRAITIARRIPSSTNVQSQTSLAINRWSEQLLVIAKKTAFDSSKDSLKEAIDIAEKIPYGSTAYNQAQQLMSEWRSQLKPPLVIPPTPTEEIINIPVQETNFLN